MTRKLVAMWIAWAVIAGAATAMAEEPALLKVGFAETDITPEIGMEQPGGYGKAFHQSIHDPCKVRAVVFDDGTRQVALVGIDAIAVHREMVQEVRRQVQEKTGLPPEAVLVGASHSHCSGPIYGARASEYEQAEPLVRRLALDESIVVPPAYYDHCLQQTVEAICQAHAGRTELACGVGRGIEDHVAFNRRFRMKNGLSFTHPGAGNPDIVEPAGPTDPEVGVIGAWDANGKLHGCVVNFACHATTNPGGASANWIYYMEQVIRGAFGPDVTVVFLQGCCGDVTQVDNLTQVVNPAGEDWARRVGGRVGAEAVKVLLSMDRGALRPVAFASETWESGRRIPSPARVAAARETVAKTPNEVGATNWTFAKETVLLDAQIAKAKTLPVEVQAIQVGPAVFVSNPAEFFVACGLELKQRSHFPFTFPVELANGCVGYVPNAEAFGPNGGGYETRLTSYSNLEPGAAQRIVDAGVRLTEGMKPGAVPSRAAIPPFSGDGWTYGNVPPELE